MRYRLLETVRQYAAARLADAGESTACASATWPTTWRWPRPLSHSAPCRARRSRPGHPRDRAAQPARGPGARGGDRSRSAALRLVNALTMFWLFTGRYQEGHAAYTRALDAAGERPTPLRGRAIAGRGASASTVAPTRQVTGGRRKR